MEQFNLKEKHIAFDNSYDVIVVGGGPAGCTAAVAASREGAKTLLIEATGMLGGLGTAGLVPAWCPFTDGEKIIYGGLAKQVFNTSRKQIKHITDADIHKWLPLDPEKLKTIYDKLVVDSGAQILFHSRLASVEMKEDGIVDAIVVANKSGLTAYKAKVYVDCTGDGDLAAWAGADFMLSGGQTPAQSSTMCFVLSNVDAYAYTYGPRMYCGNNASPIYSILQSGKYPEILDNHLTCNLIGPNTVGFNAGHVFDVDATNPESVTQAMLQGRRIAEQYRDALAEFHPTAFSNSYLAATASLMGIRESRRITGDYIFTADDYMERKSFDDEICRNCYMIDIHAVSKEIASNIKSGEDFINYQKGTQKAEKYAKGESHGIPYRCLTPSKLKNVLVAGRNISCDQLAHSSVRVMPVCLSLGEAAGMAAAHAVHIKDNDVHKVDTVLLRNRLREEDCYLP